MRSFVRLTWEAMMLFSENERTMSTMFNRKTMEQSDAMVQAIETRVDTLDWQSVSTQLDAGGYAMLQQLLIAEECQQIAALYGNDNIFRSRVVRGRQ